MKSTSCGLGGRARKLRAWPTIILLAFAIECTAAYADDAKPNFVFIDGTAATLSPDTSGAFKLETALKNSGGKAGEASLKLLSGNDKGCGQAEIVNPKGMITLPPNAVAITQFEITNVKLPATCYIELVTAGGDGITSLKQIKLTQQFATCMVLLLLGGCLVFSGLLAVCTWHQAGQRLGFKLGSPAWDFTKSWSSNIALASAVISTALALSALPELTKFASKSGYSGLALLFSFAIVVAPFVFIAFRTGAADEKTEPPAVVYQGSLWLFLLSCAITLFASLAQLVVLCLLLLEICTEYGFSWFIPAALASTIALIIALGRYARDSMILTIKLQVAYNEKTEEKAREAAIAKAKEKADQEGKTFDVQDDETLKTIRMDIERAKTLLPSWPVL